jgi:hypothetical protein
VNQVSVSMPVVGARQGLGSVTVTALCQTPVFTKENSDDGTVIVGTPEELNYVIRVYNPTNVPLENVRVEDITTYFREPLSGSADDATELMQIQTLERVEAHSRVDVRFIVPTFGYTRIDNRGEIVEAAAVLPCQVTSTCGGSGGIEVEETCFTNPSAPQCRKPTFCEQNPSAPECVCAAPNPPASCISRPDPVTVVGPGPIITEMVLAPQRDWNDSAGGNGIAFDETPGEGAVDAADVWIEVMRTTSATTGWKVRLKDAAGHTYEKPLPAPDPSRQTQLLTGWNLGASPVVLVELVDGSETVRASFDIVAMEQELGPATGPENESLTWSIYGTPGAPTQQFLRRPATINRFLPF